jgi:transcriptional regulator with PAS, ATPase and Fis domain
MQAVFSLIDRVARTNSTVLIQGESGTGKELIARAIHFASPRSERRFLSINCGALPENLLESELFGHERGAFTGAVREKKGLFQETDQGTLFLDEIGEMSPSMQVKLLRALQEKTVRKVGGTAEETVDVRIIAASNRDLEEAVAEGAFREDLYYRINVIPIRLPPLRERREDVETLLEYFLEQTCRESGCKRKRLSAAALKILTSHSWPGNVRELQNEIKRLVALADDVIGPELLDALKANESQPGGASRADVGGRPLRDLERQAIVETLKLTGGNKAETAKRLGISRRALYDKIEKYELK